MASFEGASRTNYFRIRPDLLEQLEQLAEAADADVVEGDEPNTYALLQSGECSIDTYYDEEDDRVVDLLAALAPLLDDSIAIVMGVGWEKLRSLSGWAAAIDPAGNTYEVNLADFYGLVREALTPGPSTLLTEVSG